MIIVTSISDALRRYWAYARAKAELRSLDERMLKDIGISRDQIEQLARQAANEAVGAPKAEPTKDFPAHTLHPAGQH